MDDQRLKEEKTRKILIGLLVVALFIYILVRVVDTVHAGELSAENEYIDETAPEIVTAESTLENELLDIYGQLEAVTERVETLETGVDELTEEQETIQEIVTEIRDSLAVTAEQNDKMIEQNDSIRLLVFIAMVGVAAIAVLLLFYHVIIDSFF